VVVWYPGLQTPARNLEARRHRVRASPISGARPACRSAEGDDRLTRRPNSYFRALVVGVLNTLRVAVVGIVLATVLGTLLGIARLSKKLAPRQDRLDLCRGAAQHPAPAAAPVLVLDLAVSAGPPRVRSTPVPGVFLSVRGPALPVARLAAAIRVSCSAPSSSAWWRRSSTANGPGASRTRPASSRRCCGVGLGLLIGPAPWAVFLIPGGRRCRSTCPALRGFNFVGGPDDHAPSSRRC